MTLTAFLLILLSSGIHVSWNIRGKGREFTPTFCAGMTLSSALLLLPVLIYSLPALTSQSFAAALPVILLVLTAALFQSLYFTGLSQAYRGGDFSRLYPLIRSLPTGIIALITLAGGERISLAGTFILILGCLIIPLRTLREIRPAAYLRRELLWGLAASLGITGYTMTDFNGITRLTGLEGFTPVTAPLIYIFFENLLTGLFLSTMALVGKKKIILNRDTFSMGFMVSLAYLPALAAMNFADNPGYISGFRQMSIPIGVVAGFLFLRERVTVPAVIGALLICGGLVLIKFF